MSDLNVLVIDGQTLVHDVINTALLELGIKQVKSAQNAFFALRLCEFTKFDIVIIAFDVRSDKDGFNLLEEMKFKGYITKTTSVVFLSADTSQSLVNCVVELQPTDFWVKPLDRSKVERRIQHIVGVKRKLYKLNYCIDKGEYPTAIYYAERQLEDESLKQYHPQINRLIGEALCSLLEFGQAEEFYRELTKKYDYAWVMVGLARTLLKQDKIEEATELTDKLLERDDTRFTTYDVLAEYYIEKEDYQKGYEVIQQATLLAPRNIERNKKSWNLARLNHDRKGQYIATQNMAKFAKNSIHDSPDLTLNVIRAGIDLACTLSETESTKLLAKTEKDIERIMSDRALANQLGDQLSIIRARIKNVQQDKKGAEDIMSDYMQVQASPSLEDNLDKMKAFHELGYWEQSLTLLDQIKDQIESVSFIGQVVNEYLEQESEERREIRYTPKELGEMASAHYKNKRYKPAYQMLVQAVQLSPQNANIAVSLIKVIAILAEEVGLEDDQQEALEKSLALLDSVLLSDTQAAKLKEYKDRIEAVTA